MTYSAFMVVMILKTIRDIFSVWLRTKIQRKYLWDLKPYYNSYLSHRIINSFPRIIKLQITNLTLVLQAPREQKSTKQVLISWFLFYFSWKIVYNTIHNFNRLIRFNRFRTMEIVSLEIKARMKDLAGITHKLNKSAV